MTAPRLPFRPSALLLYPLVMLSVALLIATFLRPAWIEIFFVDGGYFFMLLLFMMWTFAGVRLLSREEGFQIGSFLKKHGAVLLLAATLSVLVFWTIPAQFRVLADETNLLAVSKSFLFQKKAVNVLEGIRTAEGFEPWVHAVTKRPLMFPFVLHLVHGFAGYRLGNVFFLNFILLFILLASIGVVFQKKAGLWAVLLVFIFILSQPLITLFAASGGYDLFHTLFFGIAIGALIRYGERPNPRSFAFLWSTLLVLAHIRHESFLYLLAVGAVGMATRFFRAEHIRHSLVFASTPLFLLPLIWQRWMVGTEFRQDPSTSLFGLSHWIHNHYVFFKSLFDVRFVLPVNNVLNLLGLIASVAIAGGFLRVLKDVPHRRQACGMLILVLLGLQWNVVMSFFGGGIDLAASSRYYMISCTAIAMITAWGLLTLCKNSQKWVAAAVVVSLILFWPYHRIAMRNTVVGSQEFLLKYHALRNEFLKHQADKNFLLVHRVPSLFTPENYGSISFQKANESALHLKHMRERARFREIYVVEDVTHPESLSELDVMLSDAFQLEPVTILPISDSAYLRVSRVTEIRT